MIRYRDNQFLQALAVIAGFYILWRLKAVVIVVFVAFLIATTLSPLVLWLKKHRVPTALAVIIPLLLFVVILGLLFYLLLPPFIHKVAAFIGQLPALLSSISQKFHLSLDTKHLNGYLNGHASNLSHYAFIITGTAIKLLAGVISILVLSIYWLGSYESVRKSILSYFKGAKRRRLDDIWERVELKLRQWLKAHLMLNTVVGLLVWISMSLMHIEFADLLALTAFLIEIIPTAGPLLAATPAVLLGLSSSLVKGLVVALIYLAIQQIESHILSPLLLGKTVRLHPIVIITSLLIGAEAFGIIGALLAVPVSLCVSAVVDSYRGDPKPSDKIIPNVKMPGKASK